MSLRPYKFIVTPIVQRLDGDNVVGEENVTLNDEDGNTQPIILFGCEALEEFARDFTKRLDDPRGTR